MKMSNLIKAAFYATKDRQYVNKLNKGKLTNPEDIHYSKILENASGAAAQTFKESVIRWKAAYNQNIDRLELVDRINEPFRKRSLLENIFRSIFK